MGSSGTRKSLPMPSADKRLPIEKMRLLGILTRNEPILRCEVVPCSRLKWRPHGADEFQRYPWQVRSAFYTEVTTAAALGDLQE